MAAAEFSEEETQYSFYDLSSLREGFEGIKPYMDEPEIEEGADDVETERQEEDVEFQNDDAPPNNRLHNPDLWWCTCEECETGTLEKAVEHRCCAEYTSMRCIIDDTNRTSDEGKI